MPRKKKNNSRRRKSWPTIPVAGIGLAAGTAKAARVDDAINLMLMDDSTFDANEAAWNATGVDSNGLAGAFQALAESPAATPGGMLSIGASWAVYGFIRKMMPTKSLKIGPVRLGL